MHSLTVGLHLEHVTVAGAKHSCGFACRIVRYGILMVKYDASCLTDRQVHSAKRRPDRMIASYELPAASRYGSSYHKMKEHFR